MSSSSRKRSAAPSPTPALVLEGHSKGVTSVSWSGDGDRLASSSKDRTVRVWDARGGAAAELRAHTDAVTEVCWGPGRGSLLLASASWDGTVRIWDARASSPAHSAEVGGENISLRWSPDGSLVAVLNNMDVLTLLDARTFGVLARARVSSGRPAETFAFAADSRHLLVGSDSGRVDAHSVAALAGAGTASAAAESVASVGAHVGVCYAVAADRQGVRLATAGADGVAAVWDAAELVCTATVDRHKGTVRCAAFDRTGALLASAGERGTAVDVAFSDDGSAACEVRSAFSTTSVAFSPSADALAYAGDSSPQVCVASYSLSL